MVTWVFRNIPKELDEAVREEAKVTGQNVRAVVLLAMCRQFAIGQLAIGTQIASKPSHRFIPPTEQEADAEIVAKGYHFSGKEFVAWNGSRGWKTKQGPMKDWKQAMVTWETRWKEAHAGGNGNARKTAGQLRSERLDALFAEVEDSEADGKDTPPGHGTGRT